MRLIAVNLGVEVTLRETFQDSRHSYRESCMYNAYILDAWCPNKEYMDSLKELISKRTDSVVSKNQRFTDSWISKNAHESVQDQTISSLYGGQEKPSLGGTKTGFMLKENKTKTTFRRLIRNKFGRKNRKKNHSCQNEKEKISQWSKISFQ